MATATMPLWSLGAPGAQGQGPEDSPRLTHYRVEESDRKIGPAAAVIVCPGGGYGMRADHEGAPVAEWLRSLGIAAFVLDYRVAPYQHPIPLGDAQRAIRIVRAHAAEWGIDPQRIAILGFSAGGHLAATAGTQWDDGQSAAEDPVERVSCRPDAMILCYPVITFLTHTHVGSVTNLLGLNATDEQKRTLSAELQVTAKTPPAFLWHTADDEAVPAQNSIFMATALGDHGVAYELHIYQQGTHGLGLAHGHASAGAWTKDCANWLALQGFARADQVEKN